jgi:hypothetical protein
LNITKASADHVNSGTVSVSGNNLSITQSGTTPSFTNCGTITVASSRTLTSTTGSFINGAGGTLTGVGTYNFGGTFTNGGSIAPGGILSLTGNATFAAGGFCPGPGVSLDVEICETTPGSGFDRLAVTGAVTLSGTLNVNVPAGCCLAPGTQYRVLTAGSVSGTFDAIQVTGHGNPVFDAIYNSTGLTLSVQSNDLAITASATAGGSISPEGVVPVPCGGSQTFTIAADSCHAIADVLVDGVSVGAVSSYEFSDVSEEHAISVSFAATTFNATASAGPGGVISPPGVVSVACGTDQTFAITPDSCFQVLDVLVDSVSVGAVTSYTFTDVTADHAIEASFSPIIYTITSAAGPGGSIDPDGSTSVACGADLTVTITPDPGYVVSDVVVDSVAVGTPTSYTFTAVAAAHTIVAAFVLDQAPEVTVSGTVTSDCDGPVAGVAVELLDGSGTAHAAVTGSGGDYQFAGIPTSTNPGQISIVVPAGRDPVSPAGGVVTIPLVADYVVDFVLACHAAVTCGDAVEAFDYGGWDAYPCATSWVTVTSDSALAAYHTNFGFNGSKVQPVRIDYNPSGDVEIHSPCGVLVRGDDRLLDIAATSLKIFGKGTVTIADGERADRGITTTGDILIVSANDQVRLAGKTLEFDARSMCLQGAKGAIVGQKNLVDVGSLAVVSTGDFTSSDAELRAGSSVTAGSIRLEAMRAAFVGETVTVNTGDLIIRSTGDNTGSDAKIKQGATVTAGDVRIEASRSAFVGEHVHLVADDLTVQSTGSYSGSEATLKQGAEVTVGTASLISGTVAKIGQNVTLTVAGNFEMSAAPGQCYIAASAIVSAATTSGTCAGSSKAATAHDEPARALSLRHAASGNGQATFAFSIPAATHVKLAIYDVAGRRLATLVDAPLSAGQHAVAWNGRNAAGSQVASGIYFVRLSAEEQTRVEKVVVVRH